MAQHANYWSCSKFADKLRGTPKLSAGTSKEWNEWHKTAKGAHPWRYWMAEEALGNIQDFVTWPIRQLYDIKYYINNRWVTKSHALTAHPDDIKPGQWNDLGNRFLFCMFNELVDFVEIELAWKWIAWNDEEYEKYAAPWYARGWFRWRVWRCPEAGLAHLDWEQTLKHEDDGVEVDTRQAEGAKEILALYTWWTKERPNREDPYVISGWDKYCEEKRSRRNDDEDSWFDFSEEEGEEQRQLTRDLLDKLHEIEAAHEQEDEDMMVRLIKVRESLWT